MFQLNISTIIIQMISRICKVATPVAKLTFNHLALKQTPIYASQTFKTCFSFSQGNKKTDPQNNNQDHISGEMPQGQSGKKSEDKIEEEDGVEPSKFGNTMLIASALALAMAYAYMEIQVIRANKKKKTDTALVKQTGSGKAQIGGEWQLIDTQGNKFGSKDLEGSYYLIYFGFTHCPDICPNSLTKLSKAVARLKKTNQAKFFNLKTIFVSVDPDRDSHEKIKKFIKLFDPQIIGVTGAHNQDEILRECMRKFKIYSSKLQFQDENEVIKGRKSYTIDHTILTYLMSDTNEYLIHLGANMGQHDLANLILEKIAEDKRQKMQKLKL